MSDDALAYKLAAEEFERAKARWKDVGAQVVREERKLRKLSQRAFAEVLGVNHTYISKIERGHELPGLLIAHRIAVTRTTGGEE